MHGSMRVVLQPTAWDVTDMRGVPVGECTGVVLQQVGVHVQWSSPGNITIPLSH